MKGIAHSYRRLLYACGAAALALALAVLVTIHDARAAGGEPQLPNLVADPPDTMALATDSSTGTPRLLLRFNGYVHNIGPGALDFRGSREKPKVSKAVEEEVQRAKAKQEGLPQKTEEELAVPPMKVTQRLFTTNVGEEETNIERAHKDEPSSGEMVYVSADGHHHWHLQRIARYSLWNAAKSAEVAPAMKVGFCLEDSQHVETSIGPSSPVYADNVAPFRAFCQQYNPDATSLFEGISPGWRDVYNKELALQWVDASNVLPGEYWLREDINPLAFVKEVAGTNAPSYATTATIIPGFDALAQSAAVTAGETSTLTLTSKAWKDTATPKYTVVTAPAHGKLGTVSGNHVTYTPEAGFTGTDSFTFSAADPTSQFPTSPAVATVSVEVAPAGVGKVLLAGDATSTYSVSDQTTAGREEAFQFTAKSSGTVEEMQFRTNANANTGVTGLKLGVFAENAGKPGEVLGTGSASGEPSASSWIKVTGLSVPVVSGTKYWLVALPTGPSTSKLHYSVATSSGGTGNVESTSGGLASLTAESAWTTYNQGPVGFQALGSTGPPPPEVKIEGAPSSMTVGSNVQLTAKVTNDSPTVTWSASAGTITSGGSYTAPSEVPAGGSATITATSEKGAKASVTITITTPPPEVKIEGAPASMTAGTSVQLTAKVTNDSPTVTWSASAGTITTGGEYTAPAEPPAGGSATVTAKTSKGAEAHVTIAITPVGGTKGLLAGSATSTYSVSDQTTAGREEAFQFTAAASGTVEEMQFRTNATASTGVTGVVMGVLAESAGKPGEVLGSATASGLPATSSWIKATGLSAHVVSGTKYWLVVLPLGPSTAKLHYSVAVNSGGTGNVESKTGGLTAMTAESSWETYNQGPVGLQAIGTTSTTASGVRATARVASRPRARAARSSFAARRASVMIDGAPARITAGTSIQFGALLAHASGAVSWRASAGTMRADGTYTAPARAPRGGAVEITARGPRGTVDRRSIAVETPVAPEAAPTIHLPEAPPAGAAAHSLQAPQAMLVDHELVTAAVPPSSGRLTLSAFAGSRRLGACETLTPAGRSFTCRIPLGHTAATAAIRVSAVLSGASGVQRSGDAPTAISPMRMLSRWLHGAAGASLQFICAP